ncbi:asparaginase [Gammaproteobacteria bacterium]|nr:asparaginase [Gammaproteobacteria bacterium]
MTTRFGDNPIVAEIRRGDLVECVHRGAWAVMDCNGHLLDAGGDVEQPTYARSSAKPLQAIPLIESGAADALALDQRHIALACGSHNGEPEHVALVDDWLTRLAADQSILACASHQPLSMRAALTLAGLQQKADQRHNNCSGKHLGFLSAAHHLGEPLCGYIDLQHPVQQRWIRLLGEMGETSLDSMALGIDGCGIPVVGAPLRAVALAMARIANPAREPAARQAACRRIVAAMMAEPVLVAGHKRFCSQAMQLGKGAFAVKTGAEGYFSAMIPSRGIGIALKIDDGASRAAELLVGALLLRHAELDAPRHQALSALINPPLKNARGLSVGAMRPTLDIA